MLTTLGTRTIGFVSFDVPNGVETVDFGTKSLSEFNAALRSAIAAGTKFWAGFSDGNESVSVNERTVESFLYGLAAGLGGEAVFSSDETQIRWLLRLITGPKAGYRNGRIRETDEYAILRLWGGYDSRVGERWFNVRVSNRALTEAERRRDAILEAALART